MNSSQSFNSLLLSFRKKYSRMANAIESQTTRNVSTMNDDDYLELVQTFKLLAKRFHCSVCDVKSSFIDSYESCIADFDSSMPDAWEYEHVKSLSESLQRQVKVKNTACFLFALWLREVEEKDIKEVEDGCESVPAQLIIDGLNDKDKEKAVLILPLIGKEYMSWISPGLIREIYDSFERLSFKYECPIKLLKEAVFNSLDGSLSYNPKALRELAQQKIIVEAPSEAHIFNISELAAGQRFVGFWLEERAMQVEQQERRLDALRKQLDEKGLLNAVEVKMQELNLAPDISRNNNLENKLFKIAKQLADYIGYYFKPFPDNGFYEALIYCGTLLLHFRSDYDRVLDLNKVQDAFFLLLHDTLTTHTKIGIDNIPKYFNERVLYWGEDEKKMMADAEYLPWALYNAFYVAPLSTISCYYDTPIPYDADLGRFRAVLDAMKVQACWKQSLWKQDIDFIGKEIRERVEALKSYGLTSLAISNMIGPIDSEPFGLLIDNDLRIWVDSPEHSEVRLPPIHKAVYLLFINHPEGISFKEMDIHRAELEEFYMRISHRTDLDEIQATIDRLISPYDNSLNEKCARIKGIFSRIIPGDMIKWYAIEGERGEKKSISLPRNLILWNKVVH